MIAKKTYPFILLFLIVACKPDEKKQSYIVDLEENRTFASRFQVQVFTDYKIITLNKPWQGSMEQVKYLLYDNEIPEIVGINNYIQIKVPINSLISNSTTHLALLESLGVEDRIVGFAQSQYIYSPQLIQRVDSGFIKEVGHDAKLNVETILDIDPDIVLVFNTSAENAQLSQLQELGQKVVLNADYLENTVLGKAEWIKFMGHFVNKTNQANVYFDKLVLRYDSLKNLTTNTNKPTVFSGTLYGGTWYLPGGRNYNSELIADAGGDYLWDENESSGWLNLDFEVVYERALEAEVWLGVANFESLDALKRMDERYTGFEAFQTGKVYTYIGRVNEKGANDYFESGNINPDRILADHIKILHPEVLPNYELYYYKRLD